MEKALLKEPCSTSKIERKALMTIFLVKRTSVD
jgi:hypothetical protein